MTPSSPPHPPIRVLLVEDNPGDARLLRALLAGVASARFAFTYADRLSAALDVLRGDPPDLVLLDLSLPDSRGLDTFTRLQPLASCLPIVVLTGTDDETLALQAVQAGAQDYLVKGRLDGDLLARALRYAVERKRAQVALQAKNEELAKTTEQLWQAAKLATMGELAASLAHELNNPLATISLRVETLLAPLAAEAPQRHALEVVQGEVERMGRLVAELLQFSRRSSQQLSTLDVRQEVAGSLSLVDYHLRSRGIAITHEAPPQPVLVRADRQQIRQVLLNLFTNAADAMPQGGQLTIRIGAEAGHPQPAAHSLGLPAAPPPYAVVEVADTGEGIAPEVLPRLWEPFYTTKPEGKGTGLGLAICRRIVQEHGGSIEIESEGVPGRGALVRVRLPQVLEES